MIWSTLACCAEREAAEACCAEREAALACCAEWEAAEACCAEWEAAEACCARGCVLSRLAEGKTGGEVKKSRMERCCFLVVLTAALAGGPLDSKSIACRNSKVL